MKNEKMLEVINSILNDESVDLVKIKERLIEDMRVEVNKSKGISSRDKILKKLWNKQTELRPYIHQCYAKYNNLYCFLDGYRLYALKDNYGYNESTAPMNVKELKPKYYDIECKIDIDDLKLFIKNAKSEKNKKPIYILENDKIKIGFTPKYLLEFCEMFDTNIIYCDNPLSPAFYENGDGEWGILLPYRIED